MAFFYLTMALFFNIAMLDFCILVYRSVHGKDQLLKKTILGTLFFFVFNKNNQATERPTGDIKNFKASDRTICMDKRDNRTRLTYFSDDNNHYWFKSEKIHANGAVIGEPRFEPATMTLQQKAMTFI